MMADAVFAPKLQDGGQLGVAVATGRGDLPGFSCRAGASTGRR